MDEDLEEGLLHEFDLRYRRADIQSGAEKNASVIEDRKGHDEEVA